MSKELQKSPKKIEFAINVFKNPDIQIFDTDRITEYLDLIKLKKPSPRQTDRLIKLYEELAIMYGLENSFWTSNLARNKYRQNLIQIRRKIVKEYDCNTSLELMLADRIVAHYWRAMRYDALLNRLTEEEDGGYSFNDQKVNVVAEVHKGVELADRQLSSNIILLKELKQPQLHIKVRTENAFISQNQQINAVNPPVSTKNETNEPK